MQTRTIANGIDTACNQCGFTNQNLANVVSPCGVGGAFFSAKLSELEDLDVDPEDILFIIRTTYSTNTSLIVADSEGRVIVSLVVVNMTTTLTFIGSGAGSGDNIDFTTADVTTNSGDTEPVVVTADAERLKPPHLLLVSILTAVAVATGALGTLG